MKKALLLLIVCLMSSVAIAQDITPVSDSVKSEKSYVYCQIVGTSQFLSNKVTVSVDFGQFRKFASDQRLVDENGKPIIFNSMVDAMNWMGEDGWEFLQAYVITMNNQNVYHWLLKLDIDKLNPDDKKEVLSKFITKKAHKDSVKSAK